jgi:DNA-directed RNA polymerase specialized sigma24 family protein
MSKLARLPDDVFQRCLRQDPLAWEQLNAWLDSMFVHYGAPVFRLTTEECADALQQMHEELLRNGCRALRSFSGRSRPETYLITITKRVAANIRYKRAPYQTAADCEPPAATGETEFHNADFWLDAQRVLKPDEMVHLRLIAQDFSDAEIADWWTRTRGEPVTENTMAVRKHRLFHKLRCKLGGNWDNSR